jgi:hypothetical protein
MNRRTTYTLTAVSLLALAIATFPEVGFAQSNVPAGVWQLNLAKSKFSPGPAPKSATLYIVAEGPNPKATGVGIDAAGNPTVSLFPNISEDGKPHPVTGIPAYDASAYTRVDAYTINITRTKGGKVVQTATALTSQDGKTITFTSTGTDADGRQINNIAVFDKQ